MTFTKSLLSVFAALAVSGGAAFAGGGMSHGAGAPQAQSMPVSSLETTDQAYFAQSSEPMMTDAFTMAESGQSPEAYDVYYIVPMEVVEVEEIWLIPSGDSQSPQG